MKFEFRRITGDEELVVRATGIGVPKQIIGDKHAVDILSRFLGARHEGYGISHDIGNSSCQEWVVRAP